MTDPRDTLREQIRHLGPHRGAVADEALALVDNLVRAGENLLRGTDRERYDRLRDALAPFVAGQKDTAA